MGAEGLDYASKPKAMVAAAFDENGNPLSFFELKVLEAYSLNKDGRVTFVIQPGHQQLFDEATSKVVEKYGVPADFIKFSYQFEHTNTIRVRQDNGEFAYDSDGNLIRREKF